MTGKSYVCILHEYCQNVIRRPPTYQTKVLENEKNPYQMTVFINNNPYGTGTGQSKKCARLEAARKALEILIPDFQKIVGSNSHQSGPVTATDRDMELFDSISVSDPRLYELSVRMALPTPYNLLIECLSRSCVPESDLKSSMISQGRSKHFFTLQLREHVIKVRFLVGVNDTFKVRMLIKLFILLCKLTITLLSLLFPSSTFYYHSITAYNIALSYSFYINNTIAFRLVPIHSTRDY
ncbi:unnamed protein product [Trichobilharzia regenti]|nr:unnamed protein product [Trichobilharzia regenti]